MSFLSLNELLKKIDQIISEAAVLELDIVSDVQSFYEIMCHLLLIFFSVSYV